MRGEHSFHNRYFKDFSRKIVVDPRSMKTRVEYVYEGTYYTMEGSKRRWLLRKAVYTLLFVLEAAAYLLSMAQRAASNYLTPVTLIQAFSAGIALLLARCVREEHCQTDISQDLPKGIDITNDFASF